MKCSIEEGSMIAVTTFAGVSRKVVILNYVDTPASNRDVTAAKADETAGDGALSLNICTVPRPI
ncbi:MAG: hypothetical protein PUB32_04135 [Clostridiales bacterium]|nr:hypothetical protein [Clostridiales bacterium]